MWPDCSPPSESSRLSISSITYLSPTGQRTRSIPLVAQRDLEADVAHHGRDDGVARSAGPVAFMLPARTSAAPRRRRRSAPVASTKIARSPSPSNATPIRQPASATARASALRMRRAAIEVDVAAVGLVADHGDVEAELAEQPRRDGRRRAVGACRSRCLNRPRRCRIGQRQRAHARGTRRPRRCVDGRRRADAGTVQRRSATIASTSRSSASVNFSPRPENTLMPLSSNGLCDAEMTTPGVEAHRARQVGDRRRRHRRRRS